ncbi:MFS family transporter protein [Sinorhizobium sojae CCBAU 05684]|uniref:MFS family transporter protein n=1 Tax=Sinorhizobium sojae CCBAU 05684 TaxID=716928 RepID=A0A249P8Y0_9HYPH|nr:MFS transporter [Sinorhizobium sojae]ASY62124.1 MFS family transporter protein [Sinorhizobium sojae CCBAU 05684]
MLANFASIFSLMLSTLLMMVAFGLQSYVIPVRSVAEDWSTLTVSIFATGYTLGFTLSCVVTPKFVLRVGHIRVFTALMTLLSIAILMCGLIVDWRAWIGFRAVSGFAIAGSYLVVESWLNERVTNENRGLLFSLYLITTMIGTIAGQYLVPLGDPTNTSLFILCGVLFSLALLPTALSSSPMPAAPTQANFDLRALFHRSPVAVVGGFLAGALSGAWLNLGGVFTQKIGLSTSEGATLLAAVLAGSALSQIPIGRASDRMDRRIVMVACGVFGVLSCLAMALAIGGGAWILYALAGCVGMVLFPIYALNVAHANDLAQPDEFVKISSGLMITYGLGTISGPLVVGPVMDAFGPAALFVVLAVYFALYAGYAAWRIGQREQHDGLVAKTDFQATTVLPTPGPDVTNPLAQQEAGPIIEDDTVPEWETQAQ